VSAVLAAGAVSLAALSPVQAAPSSSPTQFAMPRLAVLFDRGSSVLNSEARSVIAKQLSGLEPATTIRVTGYARGAKQSPTLRQLSTKRAEAVARLLLRFGVKATLKIDGLGASSPFGNTRFADRVDVVSTNVGDLLWAEEFNALKPRTFDHTVWTALLDHGYEQLGFWNFGTGEIESNTESAAFEDGSGHLNIVASNASGDWMSARLWTQGKVTFKYGELDIRAKMPVGEFNWPAIWSLGGNYSPPNQAFGTTQWPYSGEADIAEGLQHNGVVQGTIHGFDPATGGPWFGGGGFTAYAPVNDFSEKFHTYGIRWKPNQVDFTVDGETYSSNVFDGQTVTQTFNNGQTRRLTIGDNWPYNQGLLLILDNAIQAGTVAPANSSGTLSIDWIRYYKWSGVGGLTK